MTGAAFETATLYGLCGAALVGIGLFGLVLDPKPIRKILAFNLIGAGVFLVFGVIARRGAAAGFPGDPVPQALVITGIVVAFSATALAVTLVQRLSSAAAEAEQPGTSAPVAPKTEPATTGQGDGAS